jgi:protein TonB
VEPDRPSDSSETLPTVTAEADPRPADILDHTRERRRRLRRRIAVEALAVEELIDGGLLEQAISGLNTLEEQYGPEAPIEILESRLLERHGEDPRLQALLEQYGRRHHSEEDENARLLKEHQILVATAAIEEHVRLGSYEEAEQGLAELTAAHGEQAPVDELRALLTEATEARALEEVEFWPEEVDTSATSHRAAWGVVTALVVAGGAAAAFFLLPLSAPSSPSASVTEQPAAPKVGDESRTPARLLQQPPSRELAVASTVVPEVAAESGEEPETSPEPEGAAAAAPADDVASETEQASAATATPPLETGAAESAEPVVPPAPAVQDEPPGDPTPPAAGAQPLVASTSPSDDREPVEVKPLPVDLGASETPTVQRPIEAEASPATPAAPTGPIVHVVCGEPGVVCAEPVSVPTPSYPSEARERQLTGNVVVRVLVSPSGRVAAAEIERRSRYRFFDEAAVRAAAQARFEPATLAGVAGESWTRLSYNFAPSS